MPPAAAGATTGGSPSAEPFGIAPTTRPPRRRAASPTASPAGKVVVGVRRRPAPSAAVAADRCRSGTPRDTPRITWTPVPDGQTPPAQTRPGRRPNRSVPDTRSRTSALRSHGRPGRRSGTRRTECTGGLRPTESPSSGDVRCRPARHAAPRILRRPPGAAGRRPGSRSSSAPGRSRRAAGRGEGAPDPPGWARDAQGPSTRCAPAAGW